MTIMGELAERLILGDALAWDASDPADQERHDRARAIASMLGVEAFSPVRQALARWVIRGGDLDAVRQVHSTEFLACVAASTSYDEYLALSGSIRLAERRAYRARGEDTYAHDDWEEEWLRDPLTMRWRRL